MRYFTLLLTVVATMLFGGHAQAQVSSTNGSCLSALAGSSGATGETNVMIVANSCLYPVGGYTCYSLIASEKCTLSAFVVDAITSIGIPQTPTTNTGNVTFEIEYECPLYSEAISGSSFTGSPTANPPACTAAPAVYAAAVLPSAVAEEIQHVATVFATIAGSSGANCRVALPKTFATSAQLAFQGTNPSTNAPDQPVGVPVQMVNGRATFVLELASSTAVAATTLPLLFSCDGSVPTQCVANLSCLPVVFPAAPVADVVAEAETAGDTGVLSIPVGGDGAFAVATDNVGVFATVTVSTNTGNATLPLTLTLCQTNPQTAACLATPTSSLTVNIAAGATPTFSIFGVASGTIAANAAANRIAVHFTDSSGNLVGATSVAVQTN